MTTCTDRGRSLIEGSVTLDGAVVIANALRGERPPVALDPFAGTFTLTLWITILWLVGRRGAQATQNNESRFET